jgi:hypothetical protein
MKEEIGNFKGQRMLQRAQGLESFWAYSNEELPKDKHLLLLDNVQFIYELALAQLELQSLGTRAEMTSGLREFKLLDVDDEDKLRRRSAYLKSVKGKATDYYQIIQKNRTRSVNQYLTHWIYPYKGKFHPQMIRALLNIMEINQGDTVLDPFVGSGTAAVEAQLLGVDFIGIDVSPLCILQSKVKTESIYALPQILGSKEEITKKIKPSLLNLDGETLDEAINLIPDENARNFYKMAKLVAISDNARRGREFSRAFFKNLELMINSVSDYVEIVKKLELKLGKISIRWYSDIPSLLDCTGLCGKRCSCFEGIRS